MKYQCFQLLFHGLLINLALSQRENRYEEYAYRNPRARLSRYYTNPRARIVYQNLDPAELAELASGVVNMATFFGKAASPDNAELLDLAPKVFTALKPVPPQGRQTRQTPPWMAMVGSFLPNNVPLTFENGRPTIKIREDGAGNGNEFNLASLWGGGKKRNRNRYRSNNSPARSNNRYPDSREVIPARTTTNNKPNNPLQSLIGGAGGPLAEIFKGIGSGQGAGQLLLKPLTEGIGAPIGTAFGLEANSGRSSVGEDPHEELVKVWSSDDEPARKINQPVDYRQNQRVDYRENQPFSYWQNEQLDYPQNQHSDFGQGQFVDHRNFYPDPDPRSPRRKRSTAVEASSANGNVDAAKTRKKRAANDMQFLTAFIPGLLGGGSSSSRSNPFAQSIFNPENLLELLTSQSDQSFASGLARGVKSTLSNNDITNWLWFDPSGGLNPATASKLPRESSLQSGSFSHWNYNPDAVVSPKFGAINTKHINTFRRPSNIPILPDTDNSLEVFISKQGPALLQDIINGFGDSTRSNFNVGQIAKSFLPEEARPFVDIISNLPKTDTRRPAIPSHPNRSRSSWQIPNTNTHSNTSNIDKDIDIDSVDVDDGSGQDKNDDPYYNFYEDS